MSNTTATVSNMELLMEELGTPTLKAIAMVFELSPVRLYSVAKQPMEGVVYDAKVFNWQAIERFVTRRLDANKGIATIEDVINQALEIDEELKQQDGRRGSTRGEGGAYGAKIEVDGKMVAARRFANHEQSADLPVVLKKDARVFGIVLQTESHTVLRPVTKDVDGAYAFDGNDVIVISNGQLNSKGVGPSALQTAIDDRFSGEYAKQVAQEAANEAAAKAEQAAALVDTEEVSE